eukprot:scaffold32393_cov69-Phaeocystis_antarctica.AAC.7
MARPTRTLIWDVLTSDSLGWLDNSFLKIFNGTREVCRFAKTALRVCAMVVFDTARGLGALPTPQLVRSTVLLHACASRAVVLAGCALLRAAVQRPDGLGRPALLAARHTFFRQFVAGERLADVQTVAARLSASGVRCIVDHSTEELEHTEVRRDLSPTRRRPTRTRSQTRARARARTRAQTRARRGATTSTPSSSSSVGCAR